MEQSYRRQVFRASAVMVAVALLLYALSYAIQPSTALAAVLGVACVGVLAAVVADALDDRFGLVWLGLGLAAAVVYMSGTSDALRATALGLVGAGVVTALLWFIPAKSAELGERVREKL